MTKGPRSRAHECPRLRARRRGQKKTFAVRSARRDNDSKDGSKDVGGDRVIRAMLQASHGVDNEGYADAPIAVDKQLVGDSGVGYGCAGGGVGGGA